MSWDETAVLIGVYGTEGFFRHVRGKIIVNPDGSNTWENNPEGKQLCDTENACQPDEYVY